MTYLRINKIIENNYLFFKIYFQNIIKKFHPGYISLNIQRYDKKTAIYNEKYISTITNTIEYLNNISATVNMDKNTSQKNQN